MKKKYYYFGLSSKTKKRLLLKLIILGIGGLLLWTIFEQHYDTFYKQNFEQCMTRNTRYGILPILLFLGGLVIILLLVSFTHMKSSKKTKYYPYAYMFYYKKWDEWQDWWKEFKKISKRYIIYYVIGISVSLIGVILSLMC